MINIWPRLKFFRPPSSGCVGLATALLFGVAVKGHLSNRDEHGAGTGVRLHFTDPNLNFWKKIKSMAEIDTEPDPKPDSESKI